MSDPQGMVVKTISRSMVRKATIEAVRQAKERGTLSLTPGQVRYITEQPPPRS